LASNSLTFREKSKKTQQPASNVGRQTLWQYKTVLLKKWKYE